MLLLCCTLGLLATVTAQTTEDPDYYYSSVLASRTSRYGSGYASSALATVARHSPAYYPSATSDYSEFPQSFTAQSPGASGQACAQVQLAVDDYSSSSSSYSSSSSVADSYDPLYVDAELAYNCLKSVPIKPQDANDTMATVLRLAQFQSDLDDLKNPPSGYPVPPTDILAKLNDISNQAARPGGYSGQYDFEEAIRDAVSSAYDGHFAYRGATNYATFTWVRDPSLALVSVVRGSSAIPAVYCFADLNNTSGFEPSPITHINGQDANSFIQSEAAAFSLHDPDARWNAELFALPGGPSYGGFITPIVYPGPNTTILFQNGTTVRSVNRAAILRPEAWSSVMDGSDFYDALVYSGGSENVDSSDARELIRHHIRRPLHPREISSHSRKPLGRKRSTKPVIGKRDVPVGYPQPFITHPDNYEEGDIYLSGYFFDYQGQSNGLAVLSLGTFDAETDEDFKDFQKTLQSFLEECGRRTSRKLVIDISSNGGGVALLGLDTFRQFFPTMAISTTARFRATDGLNILGTDLTYDDPTSLFSAADWVDEHLQPFGNWTDLYGPVSIRGDRYTTKVQWDLCNSTIYDAPSGFDVTGCNERSQTTPSPFLEADMILMTDGYCASACAEFKELMTSQGNVKSFALGGRPQTGGMQTVGGTRGGIVVPDAAMDQFETETLTNITVTGAESAAWQRILPAPFVIQATLTINSQNNYRNDSDLPLQFFNETANCRLFFTPEMVVDVTKTWTSVADVAWSGPNGGIDQGRCVSGSYREAASIPSSQQGQAPKGGKDPKSAGSTVRVATTALVMVGVVMLGSLLS